MNIKVESKNDDFRELNNEIKSKEIQIVREIRQVFGYKHVPLVALLSNIWHETGGSLDFNQKQKSGPGEGLFQFESYHKANYKKFLKNTGKSNSSLSQIEYVYESIYNDDSSVHEKWDWNNSGEEGNFPKAWRKQIRKQWEQNDPWKATEIFSKVFLRPGKPHMQRRFDLAGELFTIYGKKSPKNFENVFHYNPITKEQWAWTEEFKHSKINAYIKNLETSRLNAYSNYMERWDSNDDGRINNKDEERLTVLNPDIGYWNTGLVTNKSDRSKY